MNKNWEVVEPMEDYHEFDTSFGYRLDNGEWKTVGWVRCDCPLGEPKKVAEFIVRACNSHEELLKACKAAREEIVCLRDQLGVKGLRFVLERIEKAIAKTDGAGVVLAARKDFGRSSTGN